MLSLQKINEICTGTRAEMINFEALWDIVECFTDTCGIFDEMIENKWLHSQQDK